MPFQARDNQEETVSSKQKRDKARYHKFIIDSICKKAKKFQIINLFNMIDIVIGE